MRLPLQCSRSLARSCVMLADGVKGLEAGGGGGCTGDAFRDSVVVRHGFRRNLADAGAVGQGFDADTWLLARVRRQCRGSQQSSRIAQPQILSCRYAEQVDFSSGQHPAGQHGAAMREYSKPLLPQRACSLEQNASRRRLLAAGICQLAGAATIGFLLALSLLRLSDSSDCAITDLLRGRSWRGNLRFPPRPCVCSGLVELLSALSSPWSPRNFLG